METNQPTNHSIITQIKFKEGARGLAQREGSPARGGLAAEAERAEHLKTLPPGARPEAVDLVRARLAAELGPDEQEKLADEALAAAARRWERERGAGASKHAAATDPVAVLQAAERELLAEERERAGGRVAHGSLAARVQSKAARAADPRHAGTPEVVKRVAERM